MFGGILPQLWTNIGNVSVQLLVLLSIFSLILVSSYLIGFSLLNRLMRKPITPFGDDEAGILLPLYIAVGLSAMLVVTFGVAWIMPIYKAGWLLLAIFLIPIFSWKTIAKTKFNLKPFLPLLIVAFILGFWHYGLRGLILGDHYIIPGAGWDLSIHKMLTDMIYLFGLPLQDPTGVAEFSNLHVGIQLMSAFFGSAFKIPIMLSMQGLAVAFYFLLTLSTRSILIIFWHHQPQWKINLISITPLIWGGTFSLFADTLGGNWAGLLYPYRLSTIRLLPSGSLYHNITQAGSVALSAAFVLAILLYMKMKKVDMHLIALTILCVGGLAKPSLIIVLAPAMALLHLYEKDYSAFVRLLVMSVVFIAITTLPQLATGEDGAVGAFVFEPLVSCHAKKDG